MADMASEPDSRIIGVIGMCSVAACSRPAARHLELLGAQRTIAGVLCERCALVTLSAFFLVDLIA
jgi:hypothetical protein